MCVKICGLATLQRRSHCNGCIKVPLQLGIQNHIRVAASRLRWWLTSRCVTIWALIIFPLKFQIECFNFFSRIDDAENNVLGLQSAGLRACLIGRCCSCSFLACTCSFVLLLRVFAWSECNSPPPPGQTFPKYKYTSLSIYKSEYSRRKFRSQTSDNMER